MVQCSSKMLRSIKLKPKEDYHNSSIYIAVQTSPQLQDTTVYFNVRIIASYKDYFTFTFRDSSIL